jgi:hypothetical protein
MMGAVYRTYTGKRNAYKLLVGKTQGKRPLGRPRRRWVHCIKMDIGEIERSVMAQDREN